MAARTSLPPIDPTKPLPLAYWPKYDDVVTEFESPVDNLYQEKQRRLLVEPLHSSWSGPGEGRPFAACADVGVFFLVKQPPLVPDVFVSLDVKLPEDPFPKPNRSYFVWEYGKPPDVVVEIVSNREGEELGEKKDLYAKIGVAYYIVWDPEELLGDKLTVMELRGRKYKASKSRWFPEIGLGVSIWQGKFEDISSNWLRWADDNGAVLPTGKERADALAKEVERLKAQLKSGNGARRHK